MKLIAVAFTVLTIPSLAFGFCPSPNGNNVNFGPADQTRIAEELLEIHRQVLSSVPRLSPSEEAWLDGELDSGDGKRRMNAYASNEHSQRIVIDSLEWRIRGLESIILSVKFDDPLMQIRSWTNIAISYSYGNGINDYLQLQEGDMISFPDGVYLPEDWSFAYTMCLHETQKILGKFVRELIDIEAVGR